MKIYTSQINPLHYLLKIRNIRCWHTVLFWMHRLSGILLSLYVLFHIGTLSLLLNPGDFDAKMQIFGSPFFVVCEWLLVIPVIYHALNGGWLILFEIFGVRRDRLVGQWFGVLSVVYILLFTAMMIFKNYDAPPKLFWAVAICVALLVLVVVTQKIWRSPASICWKYQRISGGFLLVMVPAHMLFMHLNIAIGHDSSVIITRLNNMFIKTIDIGLLVAVMFHLGYGVVTVSKDYVSAPWLNKTTGLIVWGVVILFGTIGCSIVIKL